MTVPGPAVAAGARLRRWAARAARALGADRRQRLLAVAALALAAAGLAPTLHWQRPRPHLVVVIDVTQSMNVADQVLVTGSEPMPRLAAARQALRQALDSLPCGARLGWALFTEYRSYLLLQPLEVCAHRAELRETLAAIDGRMSWAGASEVAKGLHSGLEVARKLRGAPALVFVTDGHESPPLNPRHRPRFDDKPGEVPGLVVGVGGLRPQPIPKLDAGGRPLGLWGADEVAQTDLRSQGRSGSGERLVEDGSPLAASGLGATPGSEHLSALREPYLQLLARENGLGYHRLQSGEALARALADPALAQAVQVPLEGRQLAGVLALLALAARWLPYAGLRRATQKVAPSAP